MTGRAGKVFVGEDFDDDPDMLSGLFSAHWERGEAIVEGPTGVPVAEAIAWGREQADVVLVHVTGSGYYSAGAVAPSGSDGPFPPWPEGMTVARRREPGMEHLDVVTDEPIPWAARIALALPGRGFDDRVRRIAAALAAHAGVADVRTERGEPPFSAVFRFTVLARSHAEAVEQVLAAEVAASEHRARRRGLLRRTSYEPSGWDPCSDVRPAGA